MSDLLKLAERCEAATGPDDALDYAIAEVVAQSGGGCIIADYTASIDAAMTLVPEGWFANVGPRFYDEPWLTKYRATAIKPLWDKWTPYSDWFENVEADGATPALALCAASLRARSEAAAVGGR